MTPNPCAIILSPGENCGPAGTARERHGAPAEILDYRVALDKATSLIDEPDSRTGDARTYAAPENSRPSVRLFFDLLAGWSGLLGPFPNGGGIGLLGEGLSGERRQNIIAFLIRWLPRR